MYCWLRHRSLWLRRHRYDRHRGNLDSVCPAEAAAATEPWHRAFGFIREGRNLEVSFW